MALLGAFLSLSQQHGNTSALLSLILFASSVSAAQKTVNCKRKSTRTPIPATKQKDSRAGTFVNIPIKKANDSQNAAVKILGPTSFKAKATHSSTHSILSETSFSDLTIMNMLSTPIAKSKNGTTSAEIILSG